MRIDQEQSEDLTVTRLGLIRQRERRHAVLDKVGESEQTALLTDDAPEILRDTLRDVGSIPGESVDLLEELVSILVVTDFVED